VPIPIGVDLGASSRYETRRSATRTRISFSLRRILSVGLAVWKNGVIGNDPFREFN